MNQVFKCLTTTAIILASIVTTRKPPCWPTGACRGAGCWPRAGCWGRPGCWPTAAPASAQWRIFGGAPTPAREKPRQPLEAARNPRFADPGRPLTGEEHATTYNNYYEFGTSKSIVAPAQALVTDPWSIRIEGMVATPRTIGLDELLKQVKLEERLCRFRCVEAWAMTVPWTGFPLAELLRIAEPQAGAKYVVFNTLADEKIMPGLREGFYPYPYTDGLTMAEAANELAFLAVGMYGKTLPPQNGAPIRLVTPWKYGFKQVKSIVKVTFTDGAAAAPAACAGGGGAELPRRRLTACRSRRCAAASLASCCACTTSWARPCVNSASIWPSASCCSTRWCRTRRWPCCSRMARTAWLSPTSRRASCWARAAAWSAATSQALLADAPEAMRQAVAAEDDCLFSADAATAARRPSTCRSATSALQGRPHRLLPAAAHDARAVAPGGGDLEAGHPRHQPRAEQLAGADLFAGAQRRRAGAARRCRAR